MCLFKELPHITQPPGNSHTCCPGPQEDWTHFHPSFRCLWLRAHTAARWVHNTSALCLNYEFLQKDRERRVSCAILPKVSSQMKQVPTRCCPPVRASASLALGAQQIARQLPGAGAGQGAHPWEPTVSPLLPPLPLTWCATLKTSLCKSPSASDLQRIVQPEACLSPGSAQGWRVDLKWMLLSAPQAQVQPNALHCTTSTGSGGNEDTQSPPRRSAGTWGTLAEIQLSWHWTATAAVPR